MSDASSHIVAVRDGKTRGEMRLSWSGTHKHTCVKCKARNIASDLSCEARLYPSASRGEKFRTRYVVRGETLYVSVLKREISGQICRARQDFIRQRRKAKNLAPDLSCEARLYP